MGQTWYHCTPLYLYIHNIKLVFPSSQVCVGLEWENIVLTSIQLHSSKKYDNCVHEFCSHDVTVLLFILHVCPQYGLCLHLLQGSGQVSLLCPTF